MTDRYHRYHRRALLWGVAFVGVLAAGCSRGSHGNTPVEADKAREALTRALESWKRGDKVDALQGASPPIYVIEPEWQSGAVLKDYQIVSGEEKDAHLFCTVRLTVRGADGREARQEVNYAVSTAPNVTVSRKMF